MNKLGFTPPKIIVNMPSTTCQRCMGSNECRTTGCWYNLEANPDVDAWGAVTIIVKDQQVLIGKRRDNNQWCLPGGKVEQDETPLRAAIREVKEEVNLDIIRVELTDIVESGDYRVFVVKGDVIGADNYEQLKPKDGEFTELKWMEMHELYDLLRTDDLFGYMPKVLDDLRAWVK